MPLPVRLDQRAVVSVNGADAETFLQGLLTQSALDMTAGDRRYGALLAPQGKVIADMILERTSDGFLLDCDRAAAAGLVKRLTLFKLRAAVSIAERADLCVVAFDGVADPRSLLAPTRLITTDAPNENIAGMDAYREALVAAGLAEQGVDFAAEAVFPADINMDLIGGIDFRKGCFVGQEVVSRMKRRGTARRRTLGVSAPGGERLTLAPVLAGADEIGALTSLAPSGARGLARIRIDRMTEADAACAAFAIGGVAVAIDRPAWLAAEIAALHEAK
jgi:folate-binding protein YgfZ